jgi:hypothetical protein
METKRCPRCQETKPVDEFYTTKHGLFFTYCKPCGKALRRERDEKKRQERANSHAARLRNAPGPGKRGNRPKNPSTPQGVGSIRNVDLRGAVTTIRQTTPSQWLTRAAELVRDADWSEHDRPDVFRCLISASGVHLEDRLAHIAAGGWDNRQHQGVYLPTSEVGRFLAMVNETKAARQVLSRTLALLMEVAPYEDLEVWSMQYSTGPEDVIDLFERTAALASSRGD